MQFVTAALFSFTVLAGLFMIEYGLIPTVQTGFYCDDPKISYKFRGDTIGITLLLSLTFLGPFIGVSWSSILDRYRNCIYCRVFQYCHHLIATKQTYPPPFNFTVILLPVFVIYLIFYFLFY